MKLLVIEDSTDVRLLLQLELTGRGYAVVGARDAKTGLRAAAQEQPSVILSDIGLPGMDGLALLRRLRRDPMLCATPAIAMSGFGKWPEVEAALAAGYDAVVVKPVDMR